MQIAITLTQAEVEKVLSNYISSTMSLPRDALEFNFVAGRTGDGLRTEIQVTQDINLLAQAQQNFAYPPGTRGNDLVTEAVHRVTAEGMTSHSDATSDHTAEPDGPVDPEQESVPEESKPITEKLDFRRRGRGIQKEDPKPEPEPETAAEVGGNDPDGALDHSIPESTETAQDDAQDAPAGEEEEKPQADTETKPADAPKRPLFGNLKRPNNIQ